MNDRIHRFYSSQETVSGIINLILRPVESTIPLTLFASFLFSIYAFCTLFPGVIYTNMMAHDNFIFIDGVHRIWSGHTPHLDFSTPLGALNFFWPAMFDLITDSEFKAFLLYQISFLGVVLGMVVYISRTRLNYFCAIILLIYIASIIGAPVAIGFPGSYVTYALYYNRFGWALVVISFLMILPLHVKNEAMWRFETLLWTIILWIAFYTKITYFFSIAGLLFLLVFFERRWLKVFISSTLFLLIGMGFMEVFHPGLHLAYFDDLLMTGKASQGFLLMAWDDFKGNLSALITALFAIGIVFVAYDKEKTAGFSIFFAAAFYTIFISVLIAANNWDYYGLPSLCALYTVGFMLTLKEMPRIDQAQRLQKIALISLGVLVIWSTIPEAVERQGALERFFRIGYFSKRYPYPFSFPASMKEMKIMEGDVGFLKKLDSDGNVTLAVEELRIHAIPPRQEIYQTQYAYMIAKGYEALQEVFSRWGPGPIIHLGFANPFSTLLGVPSAKGDYACYHAGRNFSESVYRLPESVFKDAKFVMFSRFPVVKETTEQLEAIYGEYVRRNYRLVYSGALWDVWMSHGN